MTSVQKTTSADHRAMTAQNAIMITALQEQLCETVEQFVDTHSRLTA